MSIQVHRFGLNDSNVVISYGRAAKADSLSSDWRVCSVGMFAVSHTFDTRITTAMSLGYAFDLDTFDTKRASNFGRFVNQLNENRDYWTHPMMLPCMFLITHALRVDSYLRDTIGPEVVAIKDYVGVTKAGTSQ